MCKSHHHKSSQYHRTSIVTENPAIFLIPSIGTIRYAVTNLISANSWRSIRALNRIVGSAFASLNRVFTVTTAIKWFFRFTRSYYSSRWNFIDGNGFFRCRCCRSWRCSCRWVCRRFCYYGRIFIKEKMLIMVNIFFPY